MTKTTYASVEHPRYGRGVQWEEVNENDELVRAGVIYGLQASMALQQAIGLTLDVWDELSEREDDDKAKLYHIEDCLRPQEI